MNYLFGLILGLISFIGWSQNAPKTYLYVGSYTSGALGDGIYVYELDPKTGQLSHIQTVDSLINSSFLVVSPQKKILYACTQTQLKTQGFISAFQINPLTGKIDLINQQPSGGRNPVHVITDATGSRVISTNYTDAGVAVFKSNPDGSLRPYEQLQEFEGSSILKGRQDQAHAHSSTLSPDGHYLFSPDLGSDQIRAFRFDTLKLLTPCAHLTLHTQPGSGPRHFTFHPNGRLAYCVEELSGTVSWYHYHQGELRPAGRSKTYQYTHPEYASADLHVSGDGKFLYVSNRKAENTLTVFKIKPRKGNLKLKSHQPTHGLTPRSFVIDPSGEFLIVANQDSNTLVTFRRNSKTGHLTKLHTTTGLTAPSSLKMIRF